MSGGYVKYENVTKEIVETIVRMKENTRVERVKKEQSIQCPWCNSFNQKKDNFCKYCGGQLHL